MPSGGLELEASFWDGHEPNGNARPGIGARRGGGVEEVVRREWRRGICFEDPVF